MSAPATTSHDPGITAPSRRVTLAVALILLALCAVGGLLRFHQLDNLTAQVDEGFQALAVEAILDHGYPTLESGYVYGRSPLFLYTQSLAAHVYGVNEWALRFPSALFGVLSIPLAYLLGRRLLADALPSRPIPWPVVAGLVLATFMALSTWQIEYARYARFYTLFQCLYLAGLVAFHAGYVQKTLTGKLLFWPLFLLTVSVHDLGVMMGLCFWAVLPLRGIPLRTKANHFLLSGLCGLVWALYNKIWRGIQASWSSAVAEVTNDGTLDLNITGDGPIPWFLAKFAGMFPGLNVPNFSVLLDVWDQQPLIPIVLMMPAVVATALLAGYKLRALSERRAGRLPDHHPLAGRLWLPLLLTALWAGALQQLAMAAVALLVHAAFHIRHRKRWLDAPELITLLALGLTAVGWVAYFWQSDAIAKHQWIPAVSSLPAIHQYFLQWFVPGWTRMLVLLLPAVFVAAHLAVHAMRRDATPSPPTPTDPADPAAEPPAPAPDRANGVWLLIVAIVAPILVTSELRWQFSESRYFLHLYPMILALLAIGVVGVGLLVASRTPRRVAPALIATVLAAALAVGFTKDLNPKNAWDVATRTHADTKDPIRSVINFPFYANWPQDQKTATLATLDHLGPDDAILVVGPVHIAANYAWYLQQQDRRVDYIASTLPIYNTRKRDEHGRWTDLVTQAEIVHDANRLWDIARTLQARNARLWVFSDTVMIEDRNWYLSDAEPELKAAVAALMADPLLIAKDGRTTVTPEDQPADRLAVALPERFDPQHQQHQPMDSARPDEPAAEPDLPLEPEVEQTPPTQTAPLAADPNAGTL